VKIKISKRNLAIKTLFGSMALFGIILRIRHYNFQLWD